MGNPTPAEILVAALGHLKAACASSGGDRIEFMDRRNIAHREFHNACVEHLPALLSALAAATARAERAEGILEQMYDVQVTREITIGTVGLRENPVHRVIYYWSKEINFAAGNPVMKFPTVSAALAWLSTDAGKTAVKRATGGKS